MPGLPIPSLGGPISPNLVFGGFTMELCVAGESLFWPPSTLPDYGVTRPGFMLDDFCQRMCSTNVCRSTAVLCHCAQMRLLTRWAQRPEAGNPNTTQWLRKQPGLSHSFMMVLIMDPFVDCFSSDSLLACWLKWRVETGHLELCWEACWILGRPNPRPTVTCCHFSAFWGHSSFLHTGKGFGISVPVGQLQIWHLHFIQPGDVTHL